MKWLAILFRQTAKFERLNSNLVINNNKFKKDYNWSPLSNIDDGIRKSFKINVDKKKLSEDSIQNNQL